ncbi:helix-turn-helix domain-containing protein [Marinobacteraceae bacterium S3BR75-40.1]
MHTVAILGFEGALATAVTGVMDLFRLAGVTWARIANEPIERHFDVRLLTRDGAPCHCINGVTLQSHGHWEALEEAHIVIVPTIGGPIDQVLADNRDLLPVLHRYAEHGADIASNCTGAFLLAEAGLLDGRTATTHWGFADAFRSRFPNVDLKAERLIAADPPVFCAGGGMAWLDLGVYLVERYCGSDTARELGKAFVIETGRTSQAAFHGLPRRSLHQDPVIHAVEAHMAAHFGDRINLDQLAETFHLSPRTFKRRFSHAVGETPLNYLRQVRIDAAKRLLENPGMTLDNVTVAVGYEDVSSFSRLFKRVTGLTPGEYRQRFRTRV